MRTQLRRTAALWLIAAAVTASGAGCSGGGGTTAAEESPSAVPGMQGSTESEFGAGGTSVGGEPTE